MAKQTISTNTFTSSTWIVNSDARKGTHTTLAAALTSASSGDTILLQTSVTENPTLKAGVNIVGYAGADLTPNVSITGKCTLTTAGSVTMQNIRFTTNSDFSIAVTGSAATIVNLRDCYLNCSTTTGISYSSSSGSSAINLYNCYGNLGTTGIGFYAATGSGSIAFFGGNWLNSGASTTASNSSACPVYLFNLGSQVTYSTSGTGSMVVTNSQVQPAAAGLNATAITTAGTGNNYAINSLFSCGSASAVSVGSGTTFAFNGMCDVSSTNTNAITGAGTFAGSCTFSGTSSLNNVTTKLQKNLNTGGISFDYGINVLNAYATGTFTPTLDGTVSGTTTYTTQSGIYTRIGNRVFVDVAIVITGATGTGNIVLGGLPFTVNASVASEGAVRMAGGAWTYPVTTTSPVYRSAVGTNTGTINCNGATGISSPLQVQNAALTLNYSCCYQV